MKIELIPIHKINPAPYNPRKDLQPGDPDYEKLKRSISEFGFVEPLIWNQRTGNLIGGHQRFKILQESGRTEVECSIVDLDPEREKTLNIALNKIEGDWDDEMLAALLQELDQDLQELAGFDQDEVDKLLSQFDFKEEDGDYSGKELDLGDFSDDSFECKCPRCGFVFDPEVKEDG
jgi:ParB-like chromosome segregation protein Spo0J